MLEKLREHKLYLKPDKCDFEQITIKYLGLVMSARRVSMDPVKVTGVRDWLVPCNQKEVQSFLGFVNFYQWFIRDFSHDAHLLFDLTKKDVPWQWGSEEQIAFKGLKKKVTSAPVLALPTDDQLFQIEADSSDIATGTVLSQLSKENRQWHPISFLSKSLSPVERNYEIYNKEMLAIVRALEEWCHWLEGARHQFKIWTDHKNLEYFHTAKKLNRRQAQWSLFLSHFDYQLHHKPRRVMGKPDALLRRADHGTGQHDNEDVILLKLELFTIRALEGLELTGEEAEILKEVQKENREGHQEEGQRSGQKRTGYCYSEARSMYQGTLNYNGV